LDDEKTWEKYHHSLLENQDNIQTNLATFGHLRHKSERDQFAA
jgi:hypothetical protein